jgi:hypothetical protein
MEIATTPWDKLLQFLPYIIPIVLLQLILMIVALVDLVRRVKTRFLPRWAWAIVIVFGELLGPILYLFVGREE